MIVASLAGSAPASAAPVKTVMATQKITIKVRRVKGTGVLLKEGVKADVVSSALQWEYIPETSVSVPYISLKLDRLPMVGNMTVLVGRTGKLTPDPVKGYIVRLPLMKKENPLLITVIDPKGDYEDWEVMVQISLLESAIFVDETCSEYALRIRELKRPAGPNLIYVGCRMGATARDLSLDILWGEIDRIQYRSKTITAETSVLTVPLESKDTSEAELSGFQQRTGAQSSYSIQYTPYIPPPYEAWAGLAFFRTGFSQNNFPSKFSQISTAFLGQFWYRPEDTQLSIMTRAFGSLLSFSNTLDPDPGFKDSVQTYFVDVEARYKVLEKKGWRIDPFLGGWYYFMRVKSRQFGLQRIINPILGAVVEREVNKRDKIGLTLRFVPLQSFFNPFTFSLSQAYTEIELTYVHPLMKRNRVFGTLYWGNLNYEPEGLARTSGSYLVIGGGYGW